MKNTCTVLLSESPVEVDTKVVDPTLISTSNYIPSLVKKLEIAQNAQNKQIEDLKLFRPLPTISADMTQSEILWKKTKRSSLSKSQSVNNNDESLSSSNDSVGMKNGRAKDKSIEDRKSTSYKKINSPPGSFPNNNDGDKIDYSSYAKKYGDPCASIDDVSDISIQSPSEFSNPLVGAVDTKEGENSAMNSEKDLSAGDSKGDEVKIPPTESEVQFIQDEKWIMGQVSEEKFDKVDEEQQNTSENARSLEIEKNPSVPRDVKNGVNKTTLLDSDAEPSSVSEILEDLTMEDNTEDFSIRSEEKELSSCEHVVNLK